MTNKLKALPHTVPHLLQEVMTRLELDHGADVTADALSLLVCSRNGLTLEELQLLLSYSQLLKSKTHSLPNSCTSDCIDIFCRQVSVVEVQ